ADAAALVPAQVHDDAALALDAVERGIQLRAALALERAERLAGQALRVHAHERAIDKWTLHERDMVGAGRAVAVGAHREVTVHGRHGRLHLERDALPLGDLDLGLRVVLAAALL